MFIRLSLQRAQRAIFFEVVLLSLSPPSLATGSLLSLEFHSIPSLRKINPSLSFAPFFCNIISYSLRTYCEQRNLRRRPKFFHSSAGLYARPRPSRPATNWINIEGQLSGDNCVIFPPLHCHDQWSNFRHRAKRETFLRPISRRI